MGFFDLFRRKKDFFSSSDTNYILIRRERRMLSKVLEQNYKRLKTRVLPRISQFKSLLTKEIEKYQSEIWKSNLEKIKALDRPLEQTIWRIKVAEGLKTKGEIISELDSIVKELDNLWSQYRNIYFQYEPGMKTIDKNIPFDIAFRIDNEFDKIPNWIWKSKESLNNFLKVARGEYGLLDRIFTW